MEAARPRHGHFLRSPRPKYSINSLQKHQPTRCCADHLNSPPFYNSRLRHSTISDDYTYTSQTTYWRRDINTPGGLDIRRGANAMPRHVHQLELEWVRCRVCASVASRGPRPRSAGKAIPQNRDRSRIKRDAAAGWQNRDRHECADNFALRADGELSPSCSDVASHEVREHGARASCF